MLELWLKYKASVKLLAWAAPHVHQWNRDRELVRAEDPDATAEELEQAAARASAANRVRLQLRLAEAQRHQACGDSEKLDEAEATVRCALEITATASDGAGYVDCLDCLAQIYKDRGDYPGMQTLLEQGIHIEASLAHPNPARIARRVHGLGISRQLQGEDATAVLEKALELHDQAMGEEHLETGNVLSDLGIQHRA